jgi:small subunit ribosomal protein S2
MADAVLAGTGREQMTAAEMAGEDAASIIAEHPEAAEAPAAE